MAAASDPASGSVMASPHAGGFASHSGGSQRSFCSSVPMARSGPAKNPPCRMTCVMGLSPQASSSTIRQAATRLSTPPPPYCAGMSKAASPSAAALWNGSHGNSSDSSYSMETGRSSRRANSRATATSRRSSSERSSSTWGSPKARPPVRHDHLAGDVARVVRREEGDHGGHLLGPRESLQRDVLLELLQALGGDR